MTDIKGYHAHVYYDAASKAKAEVVRETLLGKFKVEAGGFSDAPQGPHPVSQFNIIFEAPEFDTVVPWLMLNRDGLDVLVHPLTTDAVVDHTDFAIWLGNPVPLRLHTLPHGRGGRLPSGVTP